MSDLATAVVDALGPKAALLVGDQAAKWADYAVSLLEQKLVPNVPDAFKGAVGAALASLKGNEGTLNKVAADEFLAVARHLAAGHDDAARAAWILTATSDDEVLAMLDADSAAAQKAALDKQAEFDVIKSIVEAAGPALLMVVAHFI